MLAVQEIRGIPAFEQSFDRLQRIEVDGAPATDGACRPSGPGADEPAAATISPGFGRIP
jgi:hypothetical protein